MIKKCNQVEVLSGKDKGKKREVIEILRSKDRAKVKGINMIKKHEKTTKEKKGGIITKENFIHLSNLKNLVVETFLGSILLMLKTKRSSKDLAEHIAIKGGTTEAGIKILKKIK